MSRDISPGLPPISEMPFMIRAGTIGIGARGGTVWSSAVSSSDLHHLPFAALSIYNDLDRGNLIRCLLLQACHSMLNNK